MQFSCLRIKKISASHRTMSNNFLYCSTLILHCSRLGKCCIGKVISRTFFWPDRSKVEQWMGRKVSAWWHFLFKGNYSILQGKVSDSLINISKIEKLNFHNTKPINVGERKLRKEVVLIENEASNLRLLSKGRRFPNRGEDNQTCRTNSICIQISCGGAVDQLNICKTRFEFETNLIVAKHVESFYKVHKDDFEGIFRR